MKQLTIDWQALETAFEDNPGEFMIMVIRLSILSSTRWLSSASAGFTMLLMHNRKVVPNAAGDFRQLMSNSIDSGFV